MSYGPKTVRLITSSSQLNTVGVRVVGQISTVSPTTGSDGTRIYLIGNGFVKSGLIEIVLNNEDNSAITTNASTSAQGTLNVSFDIPSPSGFASGDLLITVRTPSTSATANFVFSDKNSSNGGRLSIIENRQAQIGQVVKVRGQDYPIQTNVGKLEIRNVTTESGLALRVSDIGAGTVGAAKNIYTDVNGVFEVSFVISKDTIYATGGVKTLLTTNPLTEDLGEDLNNPGVLDPGEDLNNNGFH